MSCSFCQIASGAKAATVLHSTERFLVFEPATRAADKLLIVPKSHYDSLSQVSDKELGEWLRVAHEVASIVRAKSFKMQINVGSPFMNVRHLYMQFSFTR